MHKKVNNKGKSNFDLATNCQTQWSEVAWLRSPRFGNWSCCEPASPLATLMGHSMGYPQKTKNRKYASKYESKNKKWNN